MSVYRSVRISLRLLCSCDVYKYPHSPSRGLCIVEVSDAELVPVKVTPTTLKRAKDVISQGYF